MASYQTSTMGPEDSEMDSLYASGEPKDKESIDDEAAEHSNTALVPLKILQGKHPDPPKEGDEVVLKVVKVYGDEAEVEYSETPASDIGEGEGGDYGEEIDKMDKENPGSY